jgi:F-type H+-transporting ATPase subunit alpha
MDTDAALFGKYLETYGEVGFAGKLFHSVVEVSGLPSVRSGEMVMFESGQLGQVAALKQGYVEVLALSKETIKVGTRVSRTGAMMSVPVGEKVLAHTVDVLGRVITGEELESQGEERPVDIVPSGIASRVKINKPMYTGVILVDLMIPLGMGQRELIVGDRKTGKSHLLLQAAVTQAKLGRVVIYAAIAKKKMEVKKIESFLKEKGVWGNSVVVAASSQDSPGEIFLCPYTAMTIAEYFRDKGRDVLLILDDMSAHAIFYRELSLISRKFPGRDSYPGDIFYVHSKLLERAGNFTVDGKQVSITCLPIAETVQGDITGYIQTNLMSMTDGHVFFDGELYFKGRRPAINPFVSVTRVGHQTQTNLAREAGRALLDLLSSFERTQSFLKFGAELGESSRQILTMGERTLTFFDQPIDVSVPYSLQLVLLALLISGMWGGKNLGKILEAYDKDKEFFKLVDSMVVESESLTALMDKVRRSADRILPNLA